MLFFDVAIYVEADNGYMYRLMNDKNTGRYIWNQVPKSKNYEDKMQSIKENGEWEDFKARWEKIIIASSNGDINVITRTNRYLLPSEEIFKQDVISRGKESRDKFLSGVVDINLYKDNTYYSVGIKGSGMNTKIIHAPHLYKVGVISGENIMEKVLSMLSATFVKYKSFTVLPYHIKYLNEYILMTERFNPLYYDE